MKNIKEFNNILEEGLGRIEQYDVSNTNSSIEERIDTISTIASVCFGKDKAKNPERLFKRLLKESMGLPSSSFEFVPILVDKVKHNELYTKILNEVKIYGEHLSMDYYLTNLREVVNVIGFEDSMEYLNTDKNELQIIKDNYFVFKVEMDIVTARQWLRHRTGNYNEKSRRYTKDEPVIYTPRSLDKVIIEDLFGNYYDIENYLKLSLDMYKEALKKTSAQNARYLLPVGLMTTVWVGGSVSYWKNFLSLRLDSHAQPEIKKYAEVINSQLKLV